MEGGEFLKEAIKKLENEIKTLERELREELPEALRKATELGDLRENSEYQTAKERQSFVQARISMLHESLSKLSMVDLSKIPTDKVSYGSIVTLQDLDENKKITYHLVSSEESDVAQGMISTVSPIGKSLMGHEEGDEVAIRTPRGIKNYKITKFKTLHN